MAFQQQQTQNTSTTNQISVYVPPKYCGKSIKNDITNILVHRSELNQINSSLINNILIYINTLENKNLQLYNEILTIETQQQQSENQLYDINNEINRLQT